MKNITYLIVITLLIYSNCNAQKSDFIVTKSNDTIYVDKINLTDSKVKTKTNGKKKKYNLDKIISFYDSAENKHYERVTNPIKEKTEPSKSDRYNYRKLENSHIDDYEKRIKYKFFQRLTDGKVKLFTQGSQYNILNNSPSPSDFMSTSYDNITYYISIYNSKLELINHKRKFEQINDDGKLKLTINVYEILKTYLYDNNEIQKRLDKLFSSKPIAKEEQIIELVNEYNNWIKSNN